jgi:hypothetical protein
VDGGLVKTRPLRPLEAAPPIGVMLGGSIDLAVAAAASAHSRAPAIDRHGVQVGEPLQAVAGGRRVLEGQVDALADGLTGAHFGEQLVELTKPRRAYDAGQIGHDEYHGRRREIVPTDEPACALATLGTPLGAARCAERNLGGRAS